MERIEFSTVRTRGCKVRDGLKVWFKFTKLSGMEFPFGVIIIGPEDGDSDQFPTTMLDVAELGAGGIPEHEILPYKEWEQREEGEGRRANHALYLAYVLQEIGKHDALCLECSHEGGKIHFTVQLADAVELQGHGNDEVVSNLFIHEPIPIQ